MKGVYRECILQPSDIPIPNLQPPVCAPPSYREVGVFMKYREVGVSVVYISSIFITVCDIQLHSNPLIQFGMC